MRLCSERTPTVMHEEPQFFSLLQTQCRQCRLKDCRSKNEGRLCFGRNAQLRCITMGRSVVDVKSFRFRIWSIGRETMIWVV